LALLRLDFELILSAGFLEANNALKNLFGTRCSKFGRLAFTGAHVKDIDTLFLHKSSAGICVGWALMMYGIAVYLDYHHHSALDNDEVGLDTSVF